MYCCFFLVPEKKSHKEYPTLLHFAAKHNLNEFCNTLMQYPDSRFALKVKNSENKAPYELARLNGNMDLASKVSYLFDF